MRYLLLVFVFVLSLSGCSSSSLPAADPTERSDSKQAFGEKCEDAKYQLDKAVEEGQTSNLRELKTNIELHCVWRRN
ncbi:hypothetical protein [Paraglaciecola arctica]|uniref:hypothetical protein n=1 Tax=Paraglaciecola arctica TaxID=1128911 RepID=UPI001C078ED4|nr:hypothetical protein [Paraglaciecola arctica]MBU3001995.1 hypothetical protein [Paraglaciecola arctica]